jgi:hypothetical protein
MYLVHRSASVDRRLLFTFAAKGQGSRRAEFNCALEVLDYVGADSIGADDDPPVVHILVEGFGCLQHAHAGPNADFAVGRDPHAVHAHHATGSRRTLWIV